MFYYGTVLTCRQTIDQTSKLSWTQNWTLNDNSNSDIISRQLGQLISHIDTNLGIELGKNIQIEQLPVSMQKREL